jgi:ferrous iron transport protein B
LEHGQKDYSRAAKQRQEMSAPVKKIVLIGNPNVGKSLLFSRITGIGVISANYPGTSVTVKNGRLKYLDTEYELLDLPGIYSLEAFTTAEATAIRMIDESDIIINVLDATNLERNLNLTVQLLEKQKPLILCLNLWDETSHKGIAIDTSGLETLIGVPVVTTCALSGVGVSELVGAVSAARIGSALCAPADRWNAIGSIINQVQRLSHRHHTTGELLSDLTIHPIGGPVCAAFVLGLTFAIVRSLGEWLVNGVCDPLFSRFYYPAILHWGDCIGIAVIRDLLVGNGGDPLQSFSILTTGVYIAVVLVFPYFFSFYLVFGLLEDSGYLPRLAVVLDSLFHKLGLHGNSSIPVMLGLGCKVPAFMAMRTLPERREKIVTTALVLMIAPCLPQSAMIFSMGMRYGSITVATIFLLLLAVAIGANQLLHKMTKGEMPEFFMEIPPYRVPSIRLLGRKIWTRIAEYGLEVLPMIVAGVLIIHLLEALGIITLMSNTVGRPLAWLLGLPKEIASVMVLGFLRKDVSIALLAPFNLSARQFVIAGIFMVLYLPCIASFFTIIKELGIKTALKITGVVLICALISGTLLHGLFVCVDFLSG